MTRRATEKRSDRRRESGVSMILALVALTALIGAGALAVDVGAMLVARTQLQAAADGSALAAAQTMIDLTGPSVALPAAKTAAVQLAAQNASIGNTSLNLLDSDMTFGNWDPFTRTFSTGIDLTDPSQVTGVHVRARMDSAANVPSPAFLSRVLGRTKFDVVAESTAYLGYSGSAPAGDLVLPIVIDCCKLKGPNCDQPYCPNVQNPPNACDLVENPQAGDGQVTCLEFASTPEQNACWTEFDSNVNTSDMVDIVQDGTQFDVSVGQAYDIDNGTKTPVVAEINDRFHGNGYPEAAGTDRYAPYNGIVDSWVVTLPVVECQSADHCAGGDPAVIVGFVCFELREVTVNPDKIIRGRFLCDTDPLISECDISGGGGLDFGLRATSPVIVR